MINRTFGFVARVHLVIFYASLTTIWYDQLRTMNVSDSVLILQIQFKLSFSFLMRSVFVFILDNKTIDYTNIDSNRTSREYHRKIVVISIDCLLFEDNAVIFSEVSFSKSSCYMEKFIFYSSPLTSSHSKHPLSMLK